MLPKVDVISRKGLRNLLRKIDKRISLYGTHRGETTVDMPVNLMRNSKLITKYYTKRGYRVEIDRCTDRIKVSWR